MKKLFSLLLILILWFSLLAQTSKQHQVLITSKSSGFTCAPFPASITSDFDSNNATLSGVPEFDWPDTVGGANYGQNTSARQPSIITNAYNGNSAVRFASGKCLVPDPGNVTYGTDNTLVLVATPSSLAGDYVLKGSGGEGGPAFISNFSAPAPFEYFFASGAHERASYGSGITGLHFIAVTHKDGTGNYIGYLDGTQVFSNAVIDAWSGKTLSVIGASTCGSGGINSDIVRIQRYNAVLTSTEISDLRTCFNGKYGTP